MAHADEADMDALSLRDDGDGTTLPIRATPHAARTALEGVVEGALRVRLAAPPVEGAANRALLALMAEVLDVPRRDLNLAAGERGRRKTLRVRSLSAAEVRQRLARARWGK